MPFAQIRKLDAPRATRQSKGRLFRYSVLYLPLLLAVDKL